MSDDPTLKIILEDGGGSSTSEGSSGSSEVSRFYSRYPHFQKSDVPATPTKSLAEQVRENDEARTAVQRATYGPNNPNAYDPNSGYKALQIPKYATGPDPGYDDWFQGMFGPKTAPSAGGPPKPPNNKPPHPPVPGSAERPFVPATLVPEVVEGGATAAGAAGVEALFAELIPVIGVAVAVFIAVNKIIPQVVDQFQKLHDQIMGWADELSATNGPLAAAKGRREIATIQQQIRAGNAMGGDLARLVDAQTKIDLAIKDIQQNLLRPFLPLLATIAEGIATVSEGAAKVSSWGSVGMELAIRQALISGVPIIGPIIADLIFKKNKGQGTPVLGLGKDMQDLLMFPLTGGTLPDIKPPKNPNRRKGVK